MNLRKIIGVAALSFSVFVSNVTVGAVENLTDTAEVTALTESNEKLEENSVNPEKEQSTERTTSESTETENTESTETETPESTESTAPESTETEAPESTETENTESTERTTPESTETENTESTESTAPESTETEKPESTESAAPENTETETPESTESTETENTESTERTTPESTETEILESTESTTPESTETENMESIARNLSAFSGGRNISLDAQVYDWEEIPFYTPSDSNGVVSKWAVAQNDTYVYFYVQINGGNEYGLPIQQSYFSVSYTDNETPNAKSMIQFAGMLTMKDGTYSDIAGSQVVYAPSQEKDKYEIEVAIPQSFFGAYDFTITFYGNSVSSVDIPVLNTFADAEEKVPVYEGITIDGNFYDWEAVGKTSVNDGKILEAAAVFDSDWVYIYLKDAGNGAAEGAGEYSSGVYELLTDTGRRTSFRLSKNGIEGIAGAVVSYSNDQYEIAIPASALKSYRSSLSFGYTHATPMITGINRLQGGNNISSSFSGIQIDGNFGDWTDYNHTLIQYSTSGALGDDADGALYLNGNVLYGHAKTYRYADEKNPYEPFTLYFNNDSENISFRFITVTADGKVNWNPGVDPSGAVKEYYLVDVAGWNNIETFEALQTPGHGNRILGHAYVKRGSGSDTELEYEIDLEVLAEYLSDSDVHPFKLAATDMKTIQAEYINIGTQRVIIAGTSSGPMLGMLLCIGVLLGTGCYRKRKEEGMYQ